VICFIGVPHGLRYKRTLGLEIWRSRMTAIARFFSRLFIDADLKTIAIFCSLGLLVSMLLIIYGLDLSEGFF
jgi:hypothetical protein